MKLRDYQKRDLKSIIYTLDAYNAFGDFNKTLILNAPVSYGKSAVMSALSKELSSKNKIIILTNITELIEQLEYFLKEMNIEYSVLKAGREKNFDSNSKVLLAMQQTSYSRLDQIKLEDFK